MEEKLPLAVKQRGEELNPAQAISMLDMDEPARPHVQRKKRQTKGDKRGVGTPKRTTFAPPRYSKRESAPTWGKVPWR